MSFRHEAILLAPVEFVPEYPEPEVLIRWADGSMIVGLPHSSSQHIVHTSPKDKDCRGRIVVPVPAGANGERKRFCDSCGEEVVVRAIGALRIDIYVFKTQKENGYSPQA